MDVADLHAALHRRALLNGFFGVTNQLVIERLFKTMILLDCAAPSDAAWNLRAVENGGEIQAAGLPMIDGRAHFYLVNAPHHFVHGPEPELRHPLPDFLGDIEEKVDDVFRRSRKFLAEHRILRRDAHGASVEMALAHHDAAHRDQRCGGESEFFRSQQGSDSDVAAGLQLAVGLYANAAA